MEGDFTQEELVYLLVKHKKWMRVKWGAERLNLSDRVLVGLDLSNFDLSYSILAHTIFERCNLNNTRIFEALAAKSKFICSSLDHSDLSYSIFSNAGFYRCSMTGVDLTYTNCSSVWFDETALTDVKFKETILQGSMFVNAIDVPDSARVLSTFAPETGSLEIWKKCRGGAIVRLLVPPDAERVTGGTRIVRASKAIVLEVIGKEKVAYSLYDRNFKYEVGDTVTPTEEFYPDWTHESASGIHGYLSRHEAEAEKEWNRDEELEWQKRNKDKRNETKNTNI